MEESCHFAKNTKAMMAFFENAKHNFFARQVHDPKLDADIYLMAHLEKPPKSTLPGTRKQRKWKLFICGWVSKERVAREGVYVPRGSLSEQGRTWIVYRGQEIEFFHRHLSGLARIEDLLQIDAADVKADIQKSGNLHITSVDAARIAYDLVGRGVLSEKQLPRIQEAIGIDRAIKPILHANQYFHFLRWLESQGLIAAQEVRKARETLKEEPYSGL